MTLAAPILRSQWERSCERLLARLAGLTDDEYRWEPVADCWNVRAHSAEPGAWTVDYPDIHPDPPPFTTIAWRMLHISDGNSIYWEYAFGPARRTFGDLAPHGDAAGAIDYLRDSQAPITASLEAIDDGELDAQVPTQFGQRWPAHRVFSVLIDEQIHHGAEIGVLRDLYRASEGERRWPRG